MTDVQLKQLFPDTYAFFSRMQRSHPFWVEIMRISEDDARLGRTLLSPLEQVFSSLHLLPGHEIVQRKIAAADSLGTLMDMLTALYVAYLYRNHGAQIVDSQEHGYDLEVSIADQLLAFGVVRFRNFDSLSEQFEREIEDEKDHMDAMKEGRDQSQEQARELLSELEHKARSLHDHPAATHQVFAALSDHHRIDKEKLLSDIISKRQGYMQEAFPHIAGVVVVDPTQGNEQATFVPFHGDDFGLEQLINRSGT